MPRPLTDNDAMREQLLETCEQMIRDRGACSFTITELAAAAGMSQSNVYRFFESKEAVYEAMAERWFHELNDMMVEVTMSDMPVREKMYQFFARRLAVKRARYQAEPALFESYMDLGDEYFDIIRGYIDLGDHYLAMIVAEAMGEGYFAGMGVDRTVSLVNLMLQPFCNPRLMMNLMHGATEDKLREAVETIFAGLVAREASAQAEAAVPEVAIRIAS